MGRCPPPKRIGQERPTAANEKGVPRRVADPQRFAEVIRNWAEESQAKRGKKSRNMKAFQREMCSPRGSYGSMFSSQERLTRRKGSFEASASTAIHTRRFVVLRRPTLMVANQQNGTDRNVCATVTGMALPRDILERRVLMTMRETRRIL
jgi:hypothetical protein